jgi:formylglycine-generating enzyme required for sulfatase activity
VHPTPSAIGEADGAAKRKANVDAAEAEAKRIAEAARDPALSVTPGSGKAFKDQLADGNPCPMCPEMVVVPAGEFLMGSKAQGSQHEVMIAQPLAVGRYAVTFDEWDACVAESGCNGYQPKDEGWGRGKRPVIYVNWDDANAYAAWLSRKTGKTYRLLSEAEREFVARAGTTTAFWWGSAISTFQANYNSDYTSFRSAKSVYRAKTVPVDSFAHNPWGLYNVHGNVWEWVEDCWHDSYQGAPSNGSAWTTACTDGSQRVFRGGSWVDDPQFLRAAYRYGFYMYVRLAIIGFRLARTLNP